MSDVNLMAEASHTPGPWTLNADAHRHEPGFYGTPNEPGEEEVYTAIRVGESGVRLTGYMRPADANLIVAAPDLLTLAHQYAAECATCAGMGKVETLSASGHPAGKVDCEDCADIRKVIAKAEGRS